MSKRIGYALLDGMLTVVIDGEPHDVAADHPRHKEIVALLTPQGVDAEANRCEQLSKLLEAQDFAVLNKVGFEDVKVVHGIVTVKGTPVRNSLTKRIADLQTAGLPFDPFIRFMVNLEQNPSPDSREALFDFLEKGHFPLTDDGCFLGYKGVNKGAGSLVDCHTGTFNMDPGQKHTMPRESVDDNRNEACGAGFHVGTIEHARGFGASMVVVKVNPRDAVSVPTSDTTKLRCCAYEVVNVFADKNAAREFSRPSYSQDEYEDKDFEDEDKDFEDEDKDFEDEDKDFEDRAQAAQHAIDAEDEAFETYTEDEFDEHADKVYPGTPAETDLPAPFVSKRAAKMSNEELAKLVLGHVPLLDELVRLVVHIGCFISEAAARKAGRAKMLAKLFPKKKR